MEEEESLTDLRVKIKELEAEGKDFKARDCREGYVAVLKLLVPLREKEERLSKQTSGIGLQLWSMF